VELGVLSGEEEARLSFVGATRTLLEAPDGTVAVIDVGGGSSEIAIGEPDGQMTWSESFRIGSGFLADAYLRSDPPSVDELEKMRRHVEGTFEGLEPPPATSAVAVGGTATSLRRLVGAELEHETLERGIRVLSSTRIAEVAERFELDPERVRLLPAGILILEAMSDLLGSRSASRAAACARGSCWSSWRAGALPSDYALAMARVSSGRRSTLSSPFSTPASPPFFMRTCAPVRLCTAIEKSGSWPTSSTSSPSPAASASGSNGPPASFGSCCGSTLSSSHASLAVSAARSFGLVRHALGRTPSRLRARPAARDCSSPFSVSGRSASGDPSAASPWRNSHSTLRHDIGT
jgi:hypothetical protein